MSLHENLQDIIKSHQHGHAEETKIKIHALCSLDLIAGFEYLNEKEPSIAQMLLQRMDVEEMKALFTRAYAKGDLALTRYLLTSEDLDDAKHKQLLKLRNKALLNACWQGHLEIVDFLLTSKELKKKADINFNKGKALSHACEKGNLEIVRYLLTSPDLTQAGVRHAPIEGEKNEPLSLAANEGHLAVVRYLLTSPEIIQAGGHHADIHAKHDAALVGAYVMNKLDVMKYLLTSPELKEHANIHTCNDYIFTDALQKNNTQLLKYFILELGMDKTPTIESLIVSQPEVAKMFAMRQLNTQLNDSLAQKSLIPKKIKL